MPEYQHDADMGVDREVNPPPAALFIPLGWDENSETKRKHYRRFYNDELEKVTDVLPKPSPFECYNLNRGQARGAKKSLWQSVTGNYKTDESG